MKKLLAVAIFGLLGTGAFAQTSQGTIVVSGSLGFDKSTDKSQEQYSSFNETQKSTNFRVKPTIGYMLADGLEIGLALGYNHITTKSYNSAYLGSLKSTSNIYDMGSFIRKYFILSDKVAVVGSAVVQYSEGKTKSKYPSEFTEELKITGFQAILAPGITFFPTEKISIGLNFGSLGYTKQKASYDYPAYKESEEPNESTKFGLDLNSSTLGLNFAYHFNL